MGSSQVQLCAVQVDLCVVQRGVGEISLQQQRQQVVARLCHVAAVAAAAVQCVVPDVWSRRRTRVISPGA